MINPKRQLENRENISKKDLNKPKILVPKLHQSPFKVSNIWQMTLMIFSVLKNKKRKMRNYVKEVKKKQKLKNQIYSMMKVMKKFRKIKIIYKFKSPNNLKKFLPICFRMTMFKLIKKFLLKIKISKKNKRKMINI